MLTLHIVPPPSWCVHSLRQIPDTEHGSSGSREMNPGGALVFGLSPPGEHPLPWGTTAFSMDTNRDHMVLCIRNAVPLEPYTATVRSSAA